MKQFCGIKRIKREFSNVRTLQQNEVAERKNRTLIEAGRTMILVTTPHNKTPYELIISRAPFISFMRPFGSPVTILNTLDHLGKFDGKADEGFLVDYFINGKAFRVYTSRTKKVEENLHVNFLENNLNVAGSSPEWLFDIDSLTNSMNYQPVRAENRTNDDAGKKSTVEPTCVEGGKIDDLGCLDQQMKSTYDSKNNNSTNNFNTASPTVNSASDKDGNFERTYGEWNFSTPIIVNVVGSSFSHPTALDEFFKMPNLEDTRIFDDAYDDRDEGAEADYNNLETVSQSVIFPLQEFTKIIPKNKSLDKKRAIGTKWVYRNKRDHRGIVVRNKAKLVAQDISQPPGFVDLEFPDRVYKVEKALYSLHQAPRAWPDIMFTVCACSRFQVQPKVSHMHAVKRIFRYLKGQPTLGLWYPKDSPLELIAYLDNDYVGPSLDRKSTTGGYQFLGCRLISWQCKKQTIVANSITEAEYIAASSYCGQVLWL
nr:uncharacterized mitochondrial protein AtMg00810-like [Tanacetum cinerariifolium]